MGTMKVKFKHFIKQCVTYYHLCQIAIYIYLCIGLYPSMYLLMYLHASLFNNYEIEGYRKDIKQRIGYTNVLIVNLPILYIFIFLL